MDEFYTTDENVDFCLNKLEECGFDVDSHLFLEPSAGAGAFSSKLNDVIAFDVNPQGEGILRKDFLYDELSLKLLKGRIVIGNPPFGRKSQLAVEFFNRAASFTDVIAFILPIQFRKYATQVKLDEAFKLISDSPLPHDTFEVKGKLVKGIRCCFQVWVRSGSAHDKGEPDLRVKTKPAISLPGLFNLWQHNGTPQSRKWVNEDWVYAVYRQGFKDYGRLFTKTEDYDEVADAVSHSTTQFFFIQPLTPEADALIHQIDFTELASRNTTTPGFGKADFVAFVQETLARQ